MNKFDKNTSSALNRSERRRLLKAGKFSDLEQMSAGITNWGKGPYPWSNVNSYQLGLLKAHDSPHSDILATQYIAAIHDWTMHNDARLVTVPNSCAAELLALGPHWDLLNQLEGTSIPIMFKLRIGDYQCVIYTSSVQIKTGQAFFKTVCWTLISEPGRNERNSWAQLRLPVGLNQALYESSLPKMYKSLPITVPELYTIIVNLLVLIAHNPKVLIPKSGALTHDQYIATKSRNSVYHNTYSLDTDLLSEWVGSLNTLLIPKTLPVEEVTQLSQENVHARQGTLAKTWVRLTNVDEGEYVEETRVKKGITYGAVYRTRKGTLVHKK